MKYNGYGIISALLKEDAPTDTREVATTVADKIITAMEKEPPRSPGKWALLPAAKIIRKVTDIKKEPETIK